MVMFRKCCFLSLFLIFSIICSGFGVVSAVEPSSKVMYVSPQGDDSNNGLTPETAKRNIQSAVYALHCKGKVFIASGRYKENLMIPKRSNIELIGVNKSNTIIDGQDKDICIDISPSSNILIQNLMITNGHAFDSDKYIGMGGGLNIEDSEVTIKNCIITQNKANGHGGGIDIGPDSVVNIENTIISKNTATCGGGIANEGTLTIKNSNVIENNADYVLEDFKRSGGGIFNELDGSLTLISSVVTKNKAEKGGGIYNDKGGVMNIRNSKVVDNISEEGDVNIYNGNYEVENGDDDNN